MIYLVLALPYPLHGQSAINECIVKIARRGEREFEVFNTSPESTNKRSAGYHILRIRRVIKATSAIYLGSFETQLRVYMPYESGLGILYNLLVGSIARLRKARFYLHHHTSAHTLAHSKRFAFLLWCLGSNVSHITLSPSMAMDLRKLYSPPGNIISYTNYLILKEAANAAPKAEKQEPSSRGLHDCLSIGYIANITIEKGIALAIQTFRLVHAKNPRSCLAIAGNIHDRKAAAIVDNARREFGNNLLVLGAVYGKEKNDFFNGIDCLIFPSLYKFEAQPLVLIEAMEKCIPALATNIGYIREMLPEGRSFPPDIFAVEASEWILKFQSQSKSLGENINNVEVPITSDQLNFLALFDVTANS
jgi:glycosyltransferase involved in cell wall biosynthesis